MKIKRWPIIRHIRYAWHSWRFNRYMRFWSSLGCFVPQQSDLDHLQAIKDGRA